MKKILCLLLALIAARAYAIERNSSSPQQYLELQAIDSATGAPKTGDAANLTAYVSLDGDTTPDTLTDTSATEVDSTKAPGVYRFDLTAGETNGANIVYSGKSTTSGVHLVPRFIATVPAGFSTLTIASNSVNSDAKKINGVATTSVTTINANIGTTQPINFTGTGSGAYAKTDVQFFGGGAGVFSNGRPEVNTTHLGGLPALWPAWLVGPIPKN